VPGAGAGAGCRVGWLLLGGLALLSTVSSLPAVRAVDSPRLSRDRVDRWAVRSLLVLLGTCMLFGAGYIAYMTFIIAFLKREGAGSGEISSFWVILGVAAIIGGYAWAPLFGRQVAALIVAVAVQFAFDRRGAATELGGDLAHRQSQPQQDFDL